MGQSYLFDQGTLRFMAEAFALVDCNNFYCSVERTFDPKLNGKPLVVLSNNDGCVVSRSDEAKQIGVKMAVPLFQVQQLLDENDAEIFSSNYELYGDMSARVMESLYEFSPEVEIYSIDEAFLGLDTRYDDLTETGVAIRENLQKWIGLPVSVGIAETKTLAKLANRIAKTSKKTKGVLNLYKSPYLKEALKSTEIMDIWGISRASAEKLRRYNIKTALDLSEIDVRLARKLLTVAGSRIVLELRGINCLPLDAVAPQKQSITCSRSFANTIANFAQIREAVAVFIAYAAEKLRRDKLAAKSVTVFALTDRFNPKPSYYSNAITYNSIYPTDTTFELQKWAFASLEKAFREGFFYRKAGVILTGIVPADTLSKRIFDDDEWRRFRRVSQAMDSINHKFGRNKIRFASANPKGDWQGKAGHMSARYTTRFDEILTVA